MNLTLMEYYRERKGYTYDKISEPSEIPVETIKKIFRGEIESLDSETWQALEKVLKPEPYDSRQNGYVNAVRETGVYRAEKKGYTLEDYYALPDDRRMELIDGEFYDMAAPTTGHQAASAEISMQIFQFVRGKKGKCQVFYAPVDVQLDCDDKTMVQPDVLVICDKDKIIRRCVMGAPDFIIEILSESTQKKDRNLKLHKYKAAGVREYWMADIDRRKVIVYFFEKDEYPVIYGMKDKIPVGIFDGELQIDFTQVENVLLGIDQ